MHLQWHEIRARAAKFSEDWKLATLARDSRAEALSYSREIGLTLPDGADLIRHRQ